MSPSDSRSSRGAVMGSRAPLASRLRARLSLERVSQVPDDSVGIRRPLSPRRARPLQAFVASRSMTGFTPPGGLATLTCLTRPSSGSRLRITADAIAFRGSDRRITPAAARAATWRTNNYHDQFLSTDKNRQASPDAPGGHRGSGEMLSASLLPPLAPVKSICLFVLPWSPGSRWASESARRQACRTAIKSACDEPTVRDSGAR